MCNQREIGKESIPEIIKEIWRSFEKLTDKAVEIAGNPELSTNVSKLLDTSVELLITIERLVNLNGLTDEEIKVILINAQKKLRNLNVIKGKE